MTNPLRPILALLAASLMPALASAAEPQAIPLDDFGGRLRSIGLVVNGQTGTFTIDTGGGVSLVSPAFARKIGCTPWGAHTGFRLTGERLDLPRCEDVRFGLPDGTQLRPVSAGVLDLGPLLFEGAPAVDGSIALDAFEGETFTLDLGNGTLTMETPDSLETRSKQATEVPIRLARQAGGHALGVMVPVASPKGTLWMSLDSGGGPPVLLRDRIAAEAGADPTAEGMQPYQLTLADKTETAVSTHALVRDMILDGVIGMPVLVRWSLTLDLEDDRLWIGRTR
ncbi:MAG: retropepsin-like domain-containing protein [Pseudomonadota bacterium]|nr:retropepsin-like domain-containing protein [Pseudomonadota bacterium]